MLDMVLGMAILVGSSAPAVPEAEAKIAYAAEQRCRWPDTPKMQPANRITKSDTPRPTPERKQYVSRDQAEADKALTCKV